MHALQVHLLDTRRAPGPAALQCVAPRRPHVQYFVEHAGSHLYVLTNAAPNEFDGGRVSAVLEASSGADYRLLRLPDGSKCRCWISL